MTTSKCAPNYSAKPARANYQNDAQRHVWQRAYYQAAARATNKAAAHAQAVQAANAAVAAMTD